MSVCPPRVDGTLTATPDDASMIVAWQRRSYAFAGLKPGRLTECASNAAIRTARDKLARQHASDQISPSTERFQSAGPRNWPPGLARISSAVHVVRMRRAQEHSEASLTGHMTK